MCLPCINNLKSQQITNTALIVDDFLLPKESMSYLCRHTLYFLHNSRYRNQKARGCENLH